MNAIHPWINIRMHRCRILGEPEPERHLQVDALPCALEHLEQLRIAPDRAADERDERRAVRLHVRDVGIEARPELVERAE